MGVKGLWSVLEPTAESFSLAEFKDLRIGIDGHYWMAQARSTHQSMERLFWLRIVLLRQVGVRSLVVVFDGKIKPDLKRSTLKERSYNRSRYGKSSPTKETRPEGRACSGVESLTKLLLDLGIPVRRCHGESDAVLAEMNATGSIDAVISDDVDGFLFGATRIIRGFTINAKKPMRSYAMREIESKLGLTREKFIVVALLLGNDYDPRGLPGVGLKTAVDFVTSPGGDSALDRVKGWKSQLLTMTEEATASADAMLTADDTERRKSTRSTRHAAISLTSPSLTVDSLKAHREFASLADAELSLVALVAQQRPNFPDEKVVQAFLKPNISFEELFPPNGGGGMKLRDPQRPWLLRDEALKRKSSRDKNKVIATARDNNNNDDGRMTCSVCGSYLRRAEYLGHVTKKHSRQCSIVLKRLSEDRVSVQCQVFGVSVGRSELCGLLFDG